MSYTIRYETKRGGSGMNTVPTNEDAKRELLKLHKQRLTARVETDAKEVIGESYKSEGKWVWYIDTEA